LTEIYVDGDACPVREEIYRVAARLRVNVLVVSNGSRPIRPPGASNVSMVIVGGSADAADDYIAERIGATDVCVTSDIPLASRCLKKGARVISPNGKRWTLANIGNALAGRDMGGTQLRPCFGVKLATGERHWQIVYTGITRGKLFMILAPLF
jgi:uncharacterized protein